jgi:hypothetical protein
LLHERTVTSADGTVWQVGFRWLPRSPRWPGVGFRQWRKRKEKSRDSNLGDWFDLGMPDSLTALIVIVLCVAAVVLAWLFVFPALFFVFDILLLLVIAGLGILARVVLRRPWIIEAKSSEGRYDWGVVGWRAAKRGVDQVALWLRNGGSPAEFRPGPTGN